MKTRSLLITASVGLTCGFLFKWLAPGRGSDPGNPSEGRSPRLASPREPMALPDPEADKQWELRLSPYLTDPVIPAPAAGATGPRAEADAVLRLLRQPVTEDSIQEGIAVLNNDAAVRYHEFIAAVFERWAREAPEAALAAAEELRETRQKVALVWKVFKVSAGEPDIIAKAMRKQATEDNREEELASLLLETEKRDGADGLRAILAESALSRGTQGLDEMAKWLRSRQDSDGLADLTRLAAVAEPFTTARWLASMQPSAERDRAVAVFAEAHAAIDPDSAAVWAESISDPAKRAAALAAVRNNPAKALPK